MSWSIHSILVYLHSSLHFTGQLNSSHTVWECESSDIFHFKGHSVQVLLMCIHICWRLKQVDQEMNCIKVQNSLENAVCVGVSNWGRLCMCWRLNCWGVVYQIAGNIKVENLQCVFSKGTSNDAPSMHVPLILCYLCRECCLTWWLDVVTCNTNQVLIKTSFEVLVCIVNCQINMKMKE